MEAKISSRHIYNALFKLCSNHNYILQNTYVFDWESDFFSVTKTGNVWEVEVKISRADYKADFQKSDKHWILSNSKAGIIHKKDPTEYNNYLMDNGYYCEDEKKRKRAFYCKSTWLNSEKFFLPNRFFYAVPHGMLTSKEIPAYAGLIYVGDKSFDYSIVKQAPFLHKRSLMLEKRLQKILLDKFWYETKSLRWDLLSSRQTIDRLRNEIDKPNLLNTGN